MRSVCGQNFPDDGGALALHVYHCAPCLRDGLAKTMKDGEKLLDEKTALVLQISELRIHLRAMCDEIGDRVRFAEARRLALELLSKSEKRVEPQQMREPTAHDLHGYKHEMGPCVCEECRKKGFA